MKTRRKTHRPSCSGITLVEVLVILAVIAVLVYIAIPGASICLESASRNSSTQYAKGLGNVFSAYAADMDQKYPDGVTSTALFQRLITEKYLPNGDSLFITKMDGKSKWNGSGPLTSANVCWDVVGRDVARAPVGVTSDADDNMPLVFSTGNAQGYQITGPSQALTITNDTHWTEGENGLVVLYKSMGAKFVRKPAGGSVIPDFVNKAYSDHRVYDVRNP